MSGLDDWLATREPPPPERLAAALRASDHAPHSTGGVRAVGLSEALSDVARLRLRQAIERPGRVRESAFRLLEADALFTYACEAALDAEDAEAALADILAAAAR